MAMTLYPAYQVGISQWWHGCSSVSWTFIDLTGIFTHQLTGWGSNLQIKIHCLVYINNWIKRELKKDDSEIFSLGDMMSVFLKVRTEWGCLYRWAQDGRSSWMSLYYFCVGNGCSASMICQCLVKILWRIRWRKSFKTFRNNLEFPRVSFLLVNHACFELIFHDAKNGQYR